MTSERLARLREWTANAAGAELPFVYSDGVLKLLDEREALLVALRAWTPSAGDEPEDLNWHHVNERGEHFFMDGYSGGADPGECPVCLSRAAIAKAEST